MDDVLMYGATQAAHDERLYAALQGIQGTGIILNEKCEFYKDSVTFLSHIVYSSKVRADPEKVQAVTAMKEPTNTGEVRRFMGMVNHLNKFLPYLTEKIKPVRYLLCKEPVELGIPPAVST